MASGPPTAALPPRTTAAYDAYVANVEVAFLARARAAAPIASSMTAARPESATQGRIVKVPHGLVHHWRGITHIPHVRLDRVLATAQRYDAYARIYAPIIESRLLCRDGARFRILTRVRERAGPVTVVLEVRSVVRFEHGTSSSYSIGASEAINEVVAAGEPDERMLPAGRDSGYLWRAHTFTRFVERAGGVDVELETIGLSRRFPAMIGWLIEPIARRLGRRSVERTLAEFATAVRDGVAFEPEPTELPEPLGPTSKGLPASPGLGRRVVQHRGDRRQRRAHRRRAGDVVVGRRLAPRPPRFRREPGVFLQRR
jgi:hypothetical protein